MNDSFRVIIKGNALDHLKETASRQKLSRLDVLRVGLKLARECLSALKKGHRILIVTKDGKTLKEFVRPLPPK